MEIKKKFDCRIEEVPIIGGFVLNSFILDKSDFTEYSEPEFGGDFAGNYEKALKEITELISPKNITRKIKVITDRLYKTIRDFQNPLNRLEGYVNMAGKKSSAAAAPAAAALTVLPKDFGIQTLRKALANGDVEKILGSFETLLQNINDNRELLKAKGYKDALHKQLLALRDALKKDNEQQNFLTDERDKKVEDNMVVINNFWTDQLMLIANTGRNILYKGTAKADEYTISILKNRIRQEVPKPRNRTFIIPKGASITILNVADQQKATNTGKTILAWRDSASDEPIALQPGEEMLINTPSGNIVVTNRSADKEGQIQVMVFRKK